MSGPGWYGNTYLLLDEAAGWVELDPARVTVMVDPDDGSVSYWLGPDGGAATVEE